MSEIKVDTLTGKTSAGDITVTSEGGAVTQSLQQGLSKAWAKNSSGYTSIEDSLNISSLDDDGTGNGGVNFTNSFANANYASAVNIVWLIGAGFQIRTIAGDSQSTSSFEFSTGYTHTNGYWLYTEDQEPSLQINGDLA